MRSLKSILIAITVLSMFSACVPQRKFEETRNKYQKCEEELAAALAANRDMETRMNEVNTTLDDLNSSVVALKRDTGITGVSLRQMTKNYDKLSETYEMLLQKNKDLLAGNVAETQKLSGQLKFTQEELQRKEDELRLLDSELRAKQKNLDALQAELKIREDRVNELEDVLKRKDEAVNALKKKVTDALLGFEKDGLTVQVKNGKVYVSLDEKLLFASGSTTVDPKGVEALKKLAKVLEQNKDINVLVEGHTDNVPLNGSGAIKDNWDLSVMRATSIVKILTKYSTIDPTRLTAAGRGEYMPVDPADTKQARTKNRRTEIILTPKLDELFQILETN